MTVCNASGASVVVGSGPEAEMTAIASLHRPISEDMRAVILSGALAELASSEHTT